MPSWMGAFLASVVVALVATPALRHLALTTGFVDRPDRRKVHRDPVPYLGGVAVMVAVLAALTFELHSTYQAAVIVALAGALGTIGLVDDHRTLDPRLRLLAEIAAAGIAVAVGVRIHATGSVPVDLVLTVIWIVGVTNALNLMDNMDGLAAGVATAALFNIFVLAVLARQPIVATMATATIGACLGFLAYNRPPASIFMGDAGSLFLGFVLAILAVEVSPNLVPPFSFLVPLLLLALPVLDTTTVTLARMRRGLPVSQGGRDHLSHRLVARGFSAQKAVAILVGAEVTIGIAALLAGRRVLSLGVAVAVAAMALGVVALLALPVRVYPKPVVGLPRKVRLAILALAVLIPALTAPAIGAIVSSDKPARRGIALAERAMEALRRADYRAAGSDFRAAAQDFTEAERLLDRPSPTIGLVLPGVSSNVIAARTIASVGEDLALAGAEVSAVLASPALQGGSGSLKLNQLEELRKVLESTSVKMNKADRRLSGINQDFLVPPLRRTVSHVSNEVDRTQTAVKRSANVAHVAHNLLGGNGPRRFFLGFANSRELTGTDALVGNWAELVAIGGDLRVERFGRVDELASGLAGSGPVEVPPEIAARWPSLDRARQWQQTSVSPDFATTAQLIQLLYQRSTGSPVDGVIVVDPPALASLLELTGPLTVPGSAAPVRADNVLALLEAPSGPLVGEVTERITAAIAESDLGGPLGVVGVLARAADHGDLRLYFTDPDTQAAVSSLAAGGRVPTASGGDSLLVVNHDAAPGDVDLHLHRGIDYTVTLDPRQSPARLSGHMNLSLAKRGGPAVPETRAHLSVFSPFLGSTLSVDGRPVATVGQQEPGRSVRSTMVGVSNGTPQIVTVTVEGEVQLSPDGWYRLDLLRQLSATPDELAVNINVPSGWRIAEVRGAERVDRHLAQARYRADAPRTIWVRLEREGLAGLWSRFFSRR